MSTISVSNITTANGSENLSLATGNTTGSRVIVNSTAGVIIASNSSINAVNIDVGTPLNTLVTNSTGAFFLANVNIDSGTLFVDGTNNRVGINNTTPDASLTVTGTANVSGITRFGANLVLGTTTISANGGVGSAGQVLTSGGTGNVYWTTPPTGDITGVTAGNGLTGGGASGDVTLNVAAANGITVAADSVGVTGGNGLVVNTTGVHVLANTGIVSNTTGTFVNATYIGTISANNASFLGGVAAAAYLSNTANKTISGGFNVVSFNLGTGSGTVTPSPVNGNYQYITNNGAFTLAAPASDCAIDILITNGSTAGSITFSGYTVGASRGGTLTTTNASRFLISIRRVNAISTYSIYAMQ